MSSYVVCYIINHVKFLAYFFIPCLMVTLTFDFGHLYHASNVSTNMIFVVIYVNTDIICL